MEILQDVQFQLNLLAETFKQNCIMHLRHQEVQCPLWQWLPYQRRTQLYQQYWNRLTHQDQFWCNVREQAQLGQQPVQVPLPSDMPMPDLEE